MSASLVLGCSVGISLDSRPRTSPRFGCGRHALAFFMDAEIFETVCTGQDLPKIEV